MKSGVSSCLRAAWRTTRANLLARPKAQQRSFSTKLSVTAQSVRIHEHGDRSALKFETQSLDGLEDGQILIENKFAGLNFIDTYQRSGLYKVPLPATLGMDGAGIVSETTPLAESKYNVKKGDKVSYYDLGSYTTHKILDAKKAIPLPEHVGFDTAAACVVQGLTAHYLSRSTYPLQRGEWCVVHAAAGGVGQFLVQIANIVGAKVIGTSSCPDKAKIARELGCHECVHYSELEDAVKEITDGEGVSVAYDGVGKSTYETSMKVLKPRGYCVLYGNASGVVPPINPLELTKNGSIFLTRPVLKDHTLTREETLWRSKEIYDWIASGGIKVSIDKVFPLANVSEAHEYIESGQTTGKVVFDCKQE